MPFTFAHPAIVLPFNYLPKKYLSLTALVAGSMAPDFEYFLRLKTYGIYGHTLAGWLYFDLPLSLILAFLFHLIVRNPLIRHLPSSLQLRLQHYTGFNWVNRFRKYWPVIVLSALVGTGSHLLWDSFTHEHGFFVTRIPSIAQSIPVVNIPVYKLLQHGGTAAGFIIIGWALWQLPPSGPRHHAGRLPYWLAVIVLTIAGIIIRMWLEPVSYIGDIVATIVGCGLLALLIVSFLWSGLRGIAFK